MNLDGSLTIENAEATRLKLLSSLEGAKDAIFDVSGVSSIDLAGMQLLIALEKECKERSIPIRLAGTPRDAVRAKLEDAGFMDKNGKYDGPFDLAFRQ